VFLLDRGLLMGGIYLNPAKFNNADGSYNINPGIFPGFDINREIAAMDQMEGREDL
jgi:hypothetical protein